MGPGVDSARGNGGCCRTMLPQPGSFESRWHLTATRLRSALADVVRPGRSLRSSVATVSGRYRDSGAGRGPVVGGRDEALAYLAYRMPATFHATGAAMRAAASAQPGFAPRSLLDAGTGPGTAAWAALAAWPNVSEITLVDREGPMAQLGQALGQRSGIASLAAATWVRADLRTWTDAPRDLVTASYLLGEIDAAERDALADRLWRMTSGLLLIVEPGTPDGFERIRAARARLIEAGATVVAPCPHDRECPMLAPDWCHFGVRLERSRLHRQAKGVELSYEDEPYSYVAASRHPADDRSARVLRRPVTRKGVIGLRLCTDVGIVERRVSRREGTTFKQAHRLGWGSSVPKELEQPD